ncbi:DUF4304 domain-containing protein [Flavobacterium orientale]|uniref:DUF4304 domain-containing protein n=1 Tax=Flavobacterium orientale TaxID=1756020 RepID=A0A916YA69_9FLAO|nr:DUF4304 domain-containing protein [Flavobacterium orientale]GGD36543.1 hypothetical protein GCM10011343_27970 [Flavobacterium orientale]
MFNLFKKKYRNEHSLPKRMWLNEHLSEKEIEKYKNIWNQISGAKFIELMDKNFTPYIKSLGFKGSKNNFYKKNKPWIYTVNIFKDKYGGSCAVNVGVHLDYIENQINTLPIPSKFQVGDCIIEKNIPLDNNNSWFFYGMNENEGIETVELIIKMFNKKGIPFLQKFEKYPNPFDEINFDDLLSPTEKFKEFGIDSKKLDWIHFHIFLSKVNIGIKNYDLAKQIILKAWNDEFNAERFDKKGVSPLLKEIEEIGKKLPPTMAINNWGESDKT